MRWAAIFILAGIFRELGQITNGHGLGPLPNSGDNPQK
jgi:hypothetical protein